MQFSVPFGGVEAALAHMHGIASHKRTAFQARLKNFLRLGLLDDVKAGRGKAAKYEAHHILLLALGLELSQMGVAPERSVELIKNNIGRISLAVLDSISTKPEGFGSDWSPTAIFFDPGALAQLTTIPDQEVLVLFGKTENLKDLTASFFAKHTRLAMISISGLLVGIGESLSSSIPAGFKDFAERAFATALVEWARSHDQHPQA
ncbi:hypothetical protein [Sphingobium baderi]|uniref:HTH merR-type domain-containing protein n=1 Tax=Sphingobium baderi TaxID=1332080 RepID=A0A0S3F2V3_9SPHN|nr:hypothetical protein [Sphingobium baderi]ALR22062.1 hypothetical protein ATN00_18885 [Sphingobium baderi]